MRASCPRGRPATPPRGRARRAPRPRARSQRAVGSADVRLRWQSFGHGGCCECLRYPRSGARIHSISRASLEKLRFRAARDDAVGTTSACAGLSAKGFPTTRCRSSARAWPADNRANPHPSGDPSRTDSGTSGSGSRLCTSTEQPVSSGRSSSAADDGRAPPAPSSASSLGRLGTRRRSASSSRTLGSFSGSVTRFGY